MGTQEKKKTSTSFFFLSQSLKTLFSIISLTKKDLDSAENLVNMLSYTYLMSDYQERQRMQQNLTDSIHFAAYRGTTSTELCHTAAVSGTMKLVSHISADPSFLWNTSFIVPLTLAV